MKTTAQIVAEVIIQLTFLVGGIVLVGMGTNFYFAFGLAFLLIYNKNTEK